MNGLAADMDRPLPASRVFTNRVRRVSTIVVPVAAVVAVLMLLPGWISPTLARARIRTALVQAGSIEAVLTASGTVVPEIEQALSSPVDARLLRLLKRPGAEVNEGEPVAELDLTESRLALEKITGNLAITDNRQHQARLELDRSLSDLDARIERKALDVEILEQKATAGQRLFEQGLASQQQAADSRLAARQSAIELAQLRRERADAQRSTDLQSEGLSLERAALTKEAAAARRTLDLATTRANRSGIVTWILSQEGTMVRRGDVIARIADLGSFRVDASVPDVNGIRIRTGMPVSVRAPGAALRGHVASVSPTIENGQARFTVALDTPSHPALRPSLGVETLVVTDQRLRTRIVAQGPYTDSTGARGQVFVVHGDRAVRTDVQFGLRGYDTLEVIRGLQEGDEVIISDMRDYLHLAEVRIR